MVVRGTGPDDPDDGVPLCLQINAEGLSSSDPEPEPSLGQKDTNLLN